MPARLLHALLTAMLLAGPAAPRAEGRWSHYGADAGATQYSPLAQITTRNVRELEIAWEYRTGELGRRQPLQGATAKVQVNPVLLPAAAGGHLVLCTPFGRVIALDPARGTERWVFEPAARIGGYATAEDPEGLAKPAFANCRGVAYWADPEAPAAARCAHRLFLATHDLKLLALDARSGDLCPGFGRGGRVDVEPDVLAAHPPAAIGEVKFPGPPTVINGVVAVGTSVRDFHRYNAPNGAVRAFDARTGDPRWVFDPLVRDSEPPHATGGGNVWGVMSADEERDLLFLPTSGPSPDFYGGTRPGDNRYADSIVALRGRTGEVVWHFQTIHHDVWDYDNAAQPTLIELSRDGQPFPAVIQATKTGMVYIFHRETGEPFFPIEERAVPTDGVPGERLSPTQPFPVKPPPLVPHDFSDADFWGITPWERDACRQQYASARKGPIFTPPSLEGTIIVPSSAGGVNWGGVAVDPQRKLLVTNVIRFAHFAQLIPMAEAGKLTQNIRENMLGAAQPLLGTPYALKQGPLTSATNMLPCIAPPYAELVGVDLARGEIAWRSTLGVWDHSLPPPMAAPYSLPLPLKWGTVSFGGPIITGGGLVFIGATGDDRFRAFALSTGQELWSAALPTGAFAMPMTYLHDGRQFVVVAAGGHAFVYQKPGELIRAWALPAAP